MTVMFVSLIIDVVDPPQTRGRYPVMSPDLEMAFSEIEKRGGRMAGGSPE